MTAAWSDHLVDGAAELRTTDRERRRIGWVSETHCWAEGWKQRRPNRKGDTLFDHGIARVAAALEADGWTIHKLRKA